MEEEKVIGEWRRYRHFNAILSFIKYRCCLLMVLRLLRECNAKRERESNGWRRFKRKVNMNKFARDD